MSSSPAVRDRPLSELRPWPRNPRRISSARLEQLKRSLLAEPEMLVARPLIALPDGTVIAGNQRLRAALDLGWVSLPVVTVDLDAGRAAEWALRDNAGYGADDELQLGLLLAELAGEGRDLELTGLDSAAVDALLAGVREPPVVDPDEVPAAPAVPRSVRGEVYELGPHRVMCGDARDANDVAELFDGRTAALAITSPPYASQRAYDADSAFTPIHPDEYVDWYAAVAANIDSVLADDGSYFCNIKEHCDDGQRHLYVTDLLLAHVRTWGWRWIDTFCWRDTKNGVPGGWANRFKDAWEPVFHYGRSGAIKMHPQANGTSSEAVFAYSSETKKTATGSGLLGEKATAQRHGVARPSNVLEIAASSTGGHSATFPMALPAWFIRAFSDEQDTVFDPFLGSGTTLIAAEAESRVCLGIEISAVYCDVIRQRYADYTGQPHLAP